MSNFYGNILKHFQEAFSSFSFRNFGGEAPQDITVNAENTKERLIIGAGDRWLKFSKVGAENNGLDSIINIFHSNPDQSVRNDTVELTVKNPDLSSKEGTTEITLTAPAKDAKGHLNGAQGFTHSINLNISNEIKERKDADTDLQNKIDSEADKRETADTDLQNSINDEVDKRETADTALQNSINDEASAREKTDTDHSKRLISLEEKIEGLSGAMHFKGIETKIPEGETLKNYSDGDVIIVGNKEYVFKTEKGFVELGDTTEENKRLTSLEERTTGAEQRLNVIQGDSDTSGSIQKALNDAKVYTDALADGQVDQNKKAIEAINDPSSGILKQSQNYTDGLANGAVKRNTEDISAINNSTTGIHATTLKEAKAYTDQLANGAVNQNTTDIADINNPNTGILQQAKDYALTLKYKNGDIAGAITFEHDTTSKPGILILNFKNIQRTKGDI